MYAYNIIWKKTDFKLQMSINNGFHAESRYNSENHYVYGLLRDLLQCNAISSKQNSTLQSNESCSNS